MAGCIREPPPHLCANGPLVRAQNVLAQGRGGWTKVWVHGVGMCLQNRGKAKEKGVGTHSRRAPLLQSSPTAQSPTHSPRLCGHSAPTPRSFILPTPPDFIRHSTGGVAATTARIWTVRVRKGVVVGGGGGTKPSNDAAVLVLYGAHWPPAIHEHLAFTKIRQAAVFAPRYSICGGSWHQHIEISTRKYPQGKSLQCGVQALCHGGAPHSST